MTLKVETDIFDASLDIAIHAGKVADYFSRSMATNEFGIHILKLYGNSIMKLVLALNLSIFDIMDDNIEKLLSRKERGVLVGSGDNR